MPKAMAAKVGSVQDWEVVGLAVISPCHTSSIPCVLGFVAASKCRCTSGCVVDHMFVVSVLHSATDLSTAQPTPPQKRPSNPTQQQRMLQWTRITIMCLQLNRSSLA